MKNVIAALRSNEIVIVTRRPEDPTRSNNGGDYGFREIWRWNSAKTLFECFFWTSAEFGFCDICGRFSQSDCLCRQFEVPREKKTLVEMFSMLKPLEYIGESMFGNLAE